MAAVASALATVMVGDIQVTYLPDGFMKMPPEHQYPDSPEGYWSAHPELLDSAGFLVFSQGGILVESDGRRLLVDLAFGPKTIQMAAVTGEGDQGAFVGGDLLDSMSRVEVVPEDVDVVAFTHLHLDHLGWSATSDASLDGGLTFAAADHVATNAEWLYWSAGDGLRSPLGPTEAELSALEGRFVAVEDAETLIPGARVVSTPGHTPGHMSISIDSADERAIILGDAFHCPLEITGTDLTFGFDTDPAAARASQHKLLTYFDAGVRIISSHFSGSAFWRSADLPR